MNHELALLADRIDWGYFEKEFGQKVSMILTAKSQIIVAIKAFEGNPHDSKTVGPLLERMASVNQKLPETLAYDRGGRGAKEVMGVKVITPGNPRKSDTAYDRKKKRYPFRRRAGIEPVFGGPQYKLQTA
ncbi:MAG: hypothetical protein MJY76_02460 [Bacteroidales bacterium]|nr:hypothetical protein [Bacteroidales bacterium]